ncbi:transcriptional activator NhaR [Pyxidicoccus sp. 3LFB2]
MDWLNYHHLYYFWVVAKEGSIVAASKKLRLAHPTISGQIRRLEEVLGEKLFAHRGRNLVLTEAGRVALRYAEAIFTLGGEFLDTIKGRASGERPLRLVVGVADVLPPSLVRRFLEPALRSAQPVRLVCRGDKSVVEFIAEMAVHTVDLVIADGPAGPNPVRVFNHLLGECGTTFFAAPKLATATRRGFPRSLEGTPFLLPGAPSAVRRALDQWFEAQGVQPKVVAEFDDSALMKDFGRQGMGVFAAPTVIEAEVMQDYGVRVVGRAEAVRQQFYAISSERKIRHPSVVAIFEAARQEIFAPK